MNKSEMLEPLPFEPGEAYEKVRRDLDTQIHSYKKIRTKAKHAANAIKISAFVLFIVGITAPLFQSVTASMIDAELKVDALALGYVAISAGGVAMLTDEIFGYSKNYKRVRELEMRLVEMLMNLDRQWRLREVAEKAPTLAEDINLLYDFKKMVHAANVEQLEQWHHDRDAAQALLTARLSEKANRDR